MSDLTVNVYTKPDSFCPGCNATKRQLQTKGIPFTELPLEDENLDAAIDLGFRTSPVVTVRLPDGAEDSWDGYRPDRIDQILKGMNDEKAS